ncbi:hypothetical protein [Sphingomonas sp. T9W2]|uniref:hypothetical protein n=1 Tax=Sphingomonas sp. T9W2 TaxID=3143183 RepID=UPI0031F4E7FB
MRLVSTLEGRTEPMRYTDGAVGASAVKEVIHRDMNAATLIIGIAMLVIAFETSVLKIIEVARSE